MTAHDIGVETIAKFSEEIEKIYRKHKTSSIVYRGHGARSFTLLPRVGRLSPPPNASSKRVNEKLMLELFRRQSIDHVEVAPADDWEHLAIAQHHGLPTRFLDWTRSPLVALYFSVCKEVESRDAKGRPKKEDAEVLVWPSQKKDLTNHPKEKPLEVKETIKYVPRIVTLRLRAQGGLFTVHPDPSLVFEPTGLVRIRIPYAARKPLKDSLFRHGMHEAVLFPDIDGLARHIEWCQTKCH